MMHMASPYGHLLINGNPVTDMQLGTVCGIDSSTARQLLTELESFGVYTVTRKGIIYSQRMIDDEKKSKIGKKHADSRWSKGVETKEKKSLPNGSLNRLPNTHSQKPEIIYSGKVIKLKEETFYSLLSKTGMDEQSFARFLDSEDLYYAELPGEVKAKWFFFLSAKVKKMESA